MLKKLLAVTGVAVVAVALGVLGWLWWESRLPETYNVMGYGTLDYGGGAVPAVPVPHGDDGHDHTATHLVSVARLRGPAGKPDRRFTLTARHATVRLASGRTADALTFDGRVPGPELRVRQGDLVEVTLVNQDVEQGVSIHWHGVDVPNAEDGVAGVTQNAVAPGGRHVYRFRADQVGTFWYHTHQSSAEDVRRGLFGAFVIELPASPRGVLDLALVAHDVGGRPALNTVDGVDARAVQAGTPVRLRLVNSENTPQTFTIAGTPFRVVAVDGTALNAPAPVSGPSLELAGGGRYDIAFTMPATPVGLALADTETGLALSADGRAGLPPAPSGPELDLSRYGTPAATPFGASSRFDRQFRFDIGRKPGFRDGRPGMHWTINGGIFPDVPVFVVERGDLVKVTIDNDTDKVHPMHLHGHHALVLSRDGKPVTGSPWWTDTLNVEGGERYEIAFRASNLGLWMDHCHNLDHAAEGLTMHLVYAGVATPFTVGGDAENHPE
jgi:FtsP/CotA-like multicopper oxidase with cupredoxin domain